MANRRKGFIDDATKVLINEVMPVAVKSLLDNVPEDQYEKIFQEKKKHWNVVLPFFSFAILRATNASEITDYLTTRFFAELRREINRRTGELLTMETPKRIDIIAEMVKYPSLLKKFNDLDDKEHMVMLAHLAKIPANQATGHFQIISEMDNQNFQLYIKIVLMKADEQFGTKVKKIGKDVWETFKEWLEEDKKKPSLVEAFKAGKKSRQAVIGSGNLPPRKPKNWFRRHRYLTVLLLWVLVMVVMIVIKATIK